MIANFENINPYDRLKKVEERNKFVDMLLSLQKKYPNDSLEYESIKLAVKAMTFSMVLHVERGKKMLTESQRGKMDKTESLMQQEYKEIFPYEKDTENDVSLKDVPNIIPCLKELLKKHKKSTEICTAFQCALSDIEMAMSQEKQFLNFIKTI